MRKIYTILLSVFFCATTAVAQEAIITQPADGETINLYRTTTGFESVYYYGIPHKSTGDWQRLVFGNDGAVYLENPLNSLYTKTWIKGRRTEGDTIAFQLPQAIYSEEDFSTGEPKYGYDNTLEMVLEPEEMIGMCRSTGAWTSYAEKTYRATRKDDNKLTPPASAKSYDGLMLYMDLEGKSQLYPVNYAFDGNDA